MRDRLANIAPRQRGSTSKVYGQRIIDYSYDLRTLVYSGEYLDVSGRDNDVVDITYSDSGHKLYVLGDQNDSVYEYDLCPYHDVRTASYNQTLSIAADITPASPVSIVFTGSGTEMRILASDVVVYHYTLSVAWDISTATLSSTDDVSSLITTPCGLLVDEDGNLLVLDCDNDTIAKLVISGDPWTVTSKSYLTYKAGNTIVTPWNVFFKPDGTRYYYFGVNGSGVELVEEWSMSTAWDISSATYTRNVDVSANVWAEGYGMYINSAGTEMYLRNSTTTLVQFTLSTPWDVSSATFTRNKTLSGSFVNGLWFNPGGTKLYHKAGTNSIYEYSLTAWDISTLSYVGSQAMPFGCLDVCFKDDGTKMLAYFSINIYEYSFSTGWLLSSISYDRVNNDPAHTGAGFFVQPSGEKLFVAGAFDGNVGVHAYELAEFSVGASLGISADVTTPQGMFSEGNKLYVLDQDDGTVHQYDIGSNYGIATGSHDLFIDSGDLVDIPDFGGGDVSGDGAIIVLADNSGRIHFFELG